MLFCNAGFAVFVPNAPGAWGSEGFYSFDGIIDAACDAAARTVIDFCRKVMEMYE